jgi:hypothetical protein
MHSASTRPKAALVLAALALSALAGCKGSDSSTTPSASASASPGPNATSTTITVQSGPNDPIAHVQVTLSAALNGDRPSGTIYGVATTPASGQVAFHSLPTSGPICITATERFYNTSASCKQPLASTETITLTASGR